MDVNYPSVEGSECPYPVYEFLRREAPVYKVPDRNQYIVSRYSDVVYVLRNPQIFSSIGSRTGQNPFGSTGHRGEASSFIETDPPEHRVRRSTMSGPFTPGRIRSYEPMVRRLANELVDRFIQDGRVEFVSQFANLLPVRVISEILGFSEGDLDWLQPWGLVEASGLYLQPPEEQEIQRQYSITATEKLRAAILARVERPRDDILSEMIQRQNETFGGFDLDRTLVDASTVYRGGIVTTAHLLGSTLLLLIQHPEQMKAVRGDFALLPRMVEEALRFESPSQWNPRRVAVDTELDGVPIPAGSYVVVAFASANRDPDKFGCPDDFDIRRNDANDHTSFGYGEHFCLGAPLARMEMRVAFEVLLSRLDAIELVPGAHLSHIPSASFRGLRELPITFEPVRVGAPSARSGS